MHIMANTRFPYMWRARNAWAPFQTINARAGSFSRMEDPNKRRPEVYSVKKIMNHLNQPINKIPHINLLLFTPTMTVLGGGPHSKSQQWLNDSGDSRHSVDRNCAPQSCSMLPHLMWTHGLCLRLLMDVASPTLLVLALANWALMGEEGRWRLTLRRREGFHFPNRQQRHERSSGPECLYLDAQLLKSNSELLCPTCLARCGCCRPFKWARLTLQEQRAGRIR